MGSRYRKKPKLAWYEKPISFTAIVRPGDEIYEEVADFMEATCLTNGELAQRAVASYVIRGRSIVRLLQLLDGGEEIPQEIQSIVASDPWVRALAEEARQSRGLPRRPPGYRRARGRPPQSLAHRKDLRGHIGVPQIPDSKPEQQVEAPDASWPFGQEPLRPQESSSLPDAATTNEDDESQH